MSFSPEQIEQIKTRVETVSIRDIIIYAQKTYPNECCGFILESGAVHPAHNVIETLYDPSLTSKTAFLIDDQSWNTARTRESPIIGIYHSHTNGIPDMSKADLSFLRWPNMIYVILGILDTNPIAAKFFWWENNEAQKLDIKI